MSSQLAIHVMTEALMTAFWICAPLLVVAFVLGIFINLIQIATSLQDPAFSTVPRLVACLAVFLFLMPWMLNRATSFTITLLRDLVQYAR
jgi:flagellar biosynthetic protein FliQ